MGTSKILIDGVGIDLTQDTVAANNLLAGIKAHDSDGESVTGSIASKAAATYTPTTADQTIAAGQYLSGAQTIKGDANLVANNIKQGVSIFGVSGNLTPGITPSGTKSITENGTYDVTEFASAAVNVPVPNDTTALESEIRNGKTAYIGGTKQTGSGKIYKVASGTFTVSDKWEVTIDHGLGTQNVIVLIQRIGEDGAVIDHVTYTNAFSAFIAPGIIPNPTQKYRLSGETTEKELIQRGFEVSIGSSTSNTYTDNGYYIPQTRNASKGIVSISDNSITVGVYNRFIYTYNWTIIGLMDGV